MSHKEIALKEGAVFITDAHYSFKHEQLLGFLRDLKEKKIPASQLVLMGDIFDLLFGHIEVTHERNREVVDLVNDLSREIEIIYLEGNHDFNLASIFPGIQLFALLEQPVSVRYEGLSIGLAHGDFGGDAGYRLYTALIRNEVIQKVLNLIDRLGGHFIIKGLDQKLANKDDCKTTEDFEKKIRKHLEAVDLDRYDYFIEGHYHQNRSFDIGRCRYINPAAFACGLHYYILEHTPSSLLKEMQYQGGQK
jgi:UDP-2,3-diacylglucosamine hydrolase